MKRGAAPKFTELGSSPAKQTDDKKTLEAIDKEEHIGTHVSEGSEESQILRLKQRCKERGGTWDSSTNSCSAQHPLEKRKGLGPRAK
tara:strand:+ start:552 stop:812 length:261 start_codon:yes stop_codon:yes gene_type:complete